MVTFLAASGTLFQNIALQKVATVLPQASKAEISNLVAGTSSSAYKRLSAADKAVVIPQITNAIGNIWLFFLVAGALSFALSMPLGVSTSHGSALDGSWANVLGAQKTRLSVAPSAAGGA